MIHSVGLKPGQRIGPYEILSLVGTGGMGEVWRARDPAIGRDVAIKIIDPNVAGDPDRLLRFEQEARAAGRLNHPNILTIYAVGRDAGFPYLVAELLQGRTLRSHLSGAALPVDTALDYAIQTAAGLTAAHDHGIVHRDLKPENLFVTSDGRVKVLDFGIAKLTAAPEGPDARTHAETATGEILGTIGYMSPEQVLGQPVDARSDLFALGAVLYEMLSGRRAFAGDSRLATLNAIVSGEPAQLEGVPPSIEAAVRHALEKPPHARFQSARDFAFHLETLRHGIAVVPRSAVAPAPQRPSPLWRALPWAVAAAAIGAAVWMNVASPGRSAGDAPAGSLRRVLLPALDPPLYAIEHPPFALSPDGRRIAFVTGAPGASRIVVQHLDELSLRPVAGTEDGFAPFFSPDGESLGFFTERQLMRVDIGGGPPARLAATPPVTRGGVWSADGYIYFAPSQSAEILRIPAGGGPTEPVGDAGAAAPAEGHVWPDLSPDGTLLLYVERHGDSYDEARIMARSLRTRATQLVVNGGTYPRFVSASRVVYSRGSTLFAVDIDAASGAPRGTPQPVLDGVRLDPLMGFACITVAHDGTMAYIAGDARPPANTLYWVTPAGRETQAFPEERPFLMPAVSPDGQSVVVTIEGVHQDLWRIDLARGVLIRLTSSPAEDFGGVWSRDGQRLAFTSVRGGRRPAAFVKPAAALDGESQIGANLFPSGWTSDGSVLASKEEPGAGQTQIRMITDRGEVTPIAESRFDRYAATLSPDGRHLAFVSTETGKPEVFVSRWPAPIEAHQASLGGGTSPVWARDSATVYYRQSDGMFAVGVGPPPAHRLSPPRLLFRGKYDEPGRPDWPRNYDVAPDGRFLMVRQTYTPPLRDTVLVFNWTGDRLAPSARSSEPRPVR